MACDSVYITRKQFVLIPSEVCPQLNSSWTKCRLSLFSCLLWSSHQCRLRDQPGKSSFYESFAKLWIHYMNLIGTIFCISLPNVINKWHRNKNIWLYVHYWFSYIVFNLLHISRFKIFWSDSRVVWTNLRNSPGFTGRYLKSHLKNCGWISLKIFWTYS